MSVQLCGNGKLHTLGGILPTSIPLAMCAKVTAIHSDCRGDLKCFQRDGDESVPGCEDSQHATTGYDYCVSPMFL